MQSHFGRSGFLDDVGKLSDPVEDLLGRDEDVGVAGIYRRGHRVDQPRLADPSPFDLGL